MTSDDLHRPPPQAYLCMDLARGEQRVVETGQAFFRIGLELLAHELGGRVTEAFEAGAYLGAESRYAAPGSVSALCNLKTVDAKGRVKERAFSYSPERFEELLAKLENLPSFAALSIHTWAEGRNNGKHLQTSSPALAISWRRKLTAWAAPLPGWVLLYVHSPHAHLLGSPQRQAAVLDFLRRVAGPADPACGEVSIEPHRPYSAPLEYLLNKERDSNVSIAESRHTVRSYSWVTIVSEEIGARLGGIEAIRATNAFYEVEHLAGGGYLLRATELFEQYDHEHAYRVFRALAPALPAGVPRAPKVYPPNLPFNTADDPDFMIVQEDPSSVIGGSGNGDG